ncbi:MAG: hypothetical protein RIQ71_1849 [Verrucomicrobiota bacterium]
MQKRQPLRTALMLVVGAALFLAGYGVSQFFGYAKIARIVEPSAPLLKEALSEMSEMSEQEMKDTLAQIRQNVGRINQEADLQALFEALAASQALAARKRGDEPAAWSYLEQRITAFRTRYDSRDMQIGDWKGVADSLYQSTGSQDE